MENRVMEILNEILGLSYGSDDSFMQEIHELSIELHQLLGYKPVIQVIGITRERQEFVASLYFLNQVNNGTTT